jgi:hypothetical protein
MRHERRHAHREVKSRASIAENPPLSTLHPSSNQCFRACVHPTSVHRASEWSWRDSQHKGKGRRRELASKARAAAQFKAPERLSHMQLPTPPRAPGLLPEPERLASESAARGAPFKLPSSVTLSSASARGPAAPGPGGLPSDCPRRHSARRGSGCQWPSHPRAASRAGRTLRGHGDLTVGFLKAGKLLLQYSPAEAAA